MSQPVGGSTGGKVYIADANRNRGGDPLRPDLAGVRNGSERRGGSTANQNGFVNQQQPDNPPSSTPQLSSDAAPLPQPTGNAQTFVLLMGDRNGKPQRVQLSPSGALMIEIEAGPKLTKMLLDLIAVTAANT